MTTTIPLQKTTYYQTPMNVQSYEVDLEPCDIDLEPYASLFLKPLTTKKCAFSKQELEAMCRDPLHSPRLILYLINFFKHMA